MQLLLVREVVLGGASAGVVEQEGAGGLGGEARRRCVQGLVAAERAAAAQSCWPQGRRTAQ
eukprot:scaffold282711_cov18-Tisochrysis_lutea.AAC.1